MEVSDRILLKYVLHALGEALAAVGSETSNDVETAFSLAIAIRTKGDQYVQQALMTVMKEVTIEAASEDAGLSVPV